MTVMVTFFAIGLFSNARFTGETQAQLSAPPEKVWNVIANLDEVPKHRPEITRVEVTEKKGERPVKWIEYTDMGGFIEFELLEEIPEKKLAVKIVSSSFGMTGTWTYELSGKEMTLLKVKEESEISSVPLRAAMTLLGRDGNLKKEIRLVQRSLKQ